ncbi:hypothetical protein J2S49_001573 [Arcanobacterium wilhelmae]|uniref:Flp pilus-assembly TadG-like N-terminal domain-containing protein n=1 Tax=Arcanobacterium wilhelmae TaxID=1803177 RepID=A0ABT9NCY0_9ACTO|nr:hypothetical protein [Arcanobacterium wilhelmae]MDP9801497.1 hypothetical protein [Arcanobacterium wilhelmae]WFN90828.1 hypothetical protein P8A24_02935 [Arcanobacterium wilhelmae]
MKGREEGNMIVLGIGVWIVALSLVFIVVSALSLHQERRELYAVADEVSLSLAASVSDAAYYSGNVAGAVTSPSYNVAELSTHAQRKLAEHGQEIQLLSVKTHADKLGVEVEKVVRIPLVPAFLGAIDEVRLTVISWARLRTIPAS